MNFLKAFVLCISFLYAGSKGKESDKIDHTYCNGRFSYCINYPDVLVPQPESDNGDGRVFKNKKGETILTVFGRLNLDTEGNVLSLEQQYNRDLQGKAPAILIKDRTITYKKLGKNFYVLSGYNNGKIFYQKTIIKEDAFAFAIMEYSEAEKATYNKLSEAVFKSFK